MPSDTPATEHRHATDRPRPDSTTAALLPLAEAAARLGLTLDATRARLRRGTLAGERRGRHWLVYVVGDTPVTERDTSPTERSELLAHVLEENTYLRRRLEEAEVERAELRRMLNLEQQTVAALRALPPGPVEAVATQPESPENPPAPVEPPLQLVARQPRPWWRRWRR